MEIRRTTQRPSFRATTIINDRKALLTGKTKSELIEDLKQFGDAKDKLELTFNEIPSKDHVSSYEAIAKFSPSSQAEPFEKTIKVHTCRKGESLSEKIKVDVLNVLFAEPEAAEPPKEVLRKTDPDAYFHKLETKIETQEKTIEELNKKISTLEKEVANIKKQQAEVDYEQMFQNFKRKTMQAIDAEQAREERLWEGTRNRVRMEAEGANLLNGLRNL